MPGEEENSNKLTSDSNLVHNLEESDFRKEILRRLDTLTQEMRTVSSAVSNIANFLLNSATESQNRTLQTLINNSSKSVSSTEPKTAINTCNQNEEQNSDGDCIIIGDRSPKSADNNIECATRIKADVINTWNLKLKKRRENFWQMLRNNNTGKTYETWMSNSPIIIPKKLQMKHIEGEPLNQTQRREKQCMDNYRAEKDLLDLRAESHEAQFKSIDKEMRELLARKASGRTKDILQKWWKEECVREEITSLKRWEKQNAKFADMYEKRFIDFYRNKNPFLKHDAFEAPKIENQRDRPQNETIRYNGSKNLPPREPQNLSTVSGTNNRSYAESTENIRNRPYGSSPTVQEKASYHQGNNLGNSSVSFTSQTPRTNDTEQTDNSTEESANGDFLSQRRRRTRRK